MFNRTLSRAFLVTRRVPSIRSFYPCSFSRLLFVQQQQQQQQELDSQQEMFKNISIKPFDKQVIDVLMAPLDPSEIEIKPDGIIYLPEIKYRRILNKAFGPGGWALMPRGKYKIDEEAKTVMQEYALYCHGQFVSQAYGEQTYSDFKTVATALEGAKSNALMRCCKDLGIASDLWDPNFIIRWKQENVVAVWCEHTTTKVKKKLYRRKDREEFTYPYKEQGLVNAPKEVHDENKTSKVEKQTTKPLEDDDATFFIDDADMFVQDPEDQPKELPKTKSSRSKKKSLVLTDTINFGKYKGKMWKDVIDDPAFQSYLAYVTKDNAKGDIPDLCREAIAYINKRA